MDSRTIEIQQRFADSWNDTEKFYDDLIEYNSEIEKLRLVREFITDLRQQGWDSFFRLGTSLSCLIISRSVNHGLRDDQKYIRIEALDGKFDVKMAEGSNVYRQYTVTSLHDKRVADLLETLKHTLAD